MPTKDRTMDECIIEWIAFKRKKHLAETTVQGYEWLLKRVSSTLQGAGLLTHPKFWTEQHVSYLIVAWQQTNSMRSVKRDVKVVSQFLDFYGNPVIRKMELVWPQDVRQHVDWLTPDQALLLLGSVTGIEQMVIHLELCIGMRRVELVRAKVSDFQEGVVQILGKGRMGGKPRTNPWHQNTKEVLATYLKVRDAEIAKARAKDPNVAVPPQLLIYERAGKLRSYQRSSIDNIVGEISRRVGFKFTNHTLRRTFGRLLWLAGVKLETIKDLLGHEDVKTTISYLGINFDDKTSAMSRLGAYTDALKTAKMGVSQ